MKSADTWNRAVLYGYDGPRAEGDRALPDLLMLDNVAQNGGLLHGVGVLNQEELTAAAGSGWTHWPTASTLLDRSSHPAEEALELRADELYFGEHGSDLIEPAFGQKLADKPGSFTGSVGN